MSRLPIIKEPDPLLRQKASKIKEITPEIKELILDMEKAMKEYKGVGIAAPQIGESIQLCLISTDKGILALINPLILWKSLRNETEEEGCLSCPGASIAVNRSIIIYIKALNQNGKLIIFRAKDLFARVIQHEVDHLNGILIIDKK